ncbi:MAG: multicopper oxidase domain-containing protein [Polyangiales bacterium]
MRLGVITILLVVFGLAPVARADQVTLQATKDNTLYQSATGALSNGAGQHLFAGRTGQSDEESRRRGLIAFDVTSSIPAGATIDSVSITLYLSRSNKAGTEIVGLHRVLSDWGEGASAASGEEGGGAPAASGDATWLHTFYPNSFWATAGGDFVTTASESIAIGGGKGEQTWSGPGLVADVQAWVDGAAPDFGWLLVGNETASDTAKRFDSLQNDKVQNRPVLTVDFTPGAGVSGACCATDGSCGVTNGNSDCTSQGGTYQGDNSVCTPNPCPLPSGACCLPEATATCTDVDEVTCTGLGGTFQGALTLCTPNPCPVVLTPFVDPLPLPAVAQPTSGEVGGAASYTMTMREVQQQLHRDLANPTTVWGFGDGASASFPGPTIEAASNKPITVTWINDLRDTAVGGSPPPLRTDHYLPVDLCPHGALDNKDARTVVHLHGGHVPPEFDGYPESTFPPGEQVVYEYANAQLPATLWYHDHALGITRLNVYMGLAGFYLVRDNVEEALGLPKCDGPCVPGQTPEYDIPVVIQDRTFNPDGSLSYPAAWQDVFFGDTILVNGKVWPYLDVKQGKYRLRFLNGSGSRTYTLALDNGASFYQIGAEGGLLPAPVTVNEITLGPGERADLVFDFAAYAAGTEITLVNSAPAPFPGPAGQGVVPNVMKFIVQAQAGHTNALPATLRSMEMLNEADAVHFRDFELKKGPGDACSPFTWEVVSTAVDGVPVTAPNTRWDDVTEFPDLETTEVWTFINKSGMTHPMHMHLVMFQVLDRQGFSVIDGEVVPIGAPVAPPPQESGWKDTAQVGPNEIVRVIARFEDYTGLFAYHCHILEHEDHEMMRQFKATSACSDGADNDGDLLFDYPEDPECTSPDDLSETADCSDGLDNDGDGLADFGSDPGCSSSSDATEKDAGLPCDDGIDNDGDGRIDFDIITYNDPAFHAGLGDPGCGDANWVSESPQCQDGVDNDPGADPDPGKIDFDGGKSATGRVLSEEPDPQCGNRPWWNLERPQSSCNVGGMEGVAPFLVLSILLLPLVTRRRRRSG